MSCDPQHSKTYKMTCVPSEDLGQHEHLHRLESDFVDESRHFVGFALLVLI